MTNDDVVIAYRDKRINRKTGRSYASNRTGSLYYNGDVLYSYGKHFPLAIRKYFNGKEVYLINSDRYSNTTNKHQCCTWRILREEDHTYLSFSTVGYDILYRSKITSFNFNLVNPYDKVIFNNNILCAGNSVHILPIDVDDFHTANMSLIPDVIKGEIVFGNCLQHRDWYFFRSDNSILKKDLSKWFEFGSGRYDSFGTNLKATRGTSIDDRIFVMGTVRHANHIIAKLDKNIIYEAVKNNAVKSYFSY